MAKKLTIKHIYNELDELLKKIDTDRSKRKAKIKERNKKRKLKKVVKKVN